MPPARTGETGRLNPDQAPDVARSAPWSTPMSRRACAEVAALHPMCLAGVYLVGEALRLFRGRPIVIRAEEIADERSCPVDERCCRGGGCTGRGRGGCGFFASRSRVSGADNRALDEVREGAVWPERQGALRV